MPDLERLTDELLIDMSPTPEGKAYWKGYSKGKSRARWEIVGLIVCLSALAVFVWSNIK